ncbi:MAG: hypothetical protein U9R75_11850, partial [Candidatus Thermoplasmatota archaeon]|nr:hypothetical protein [Candidatus Thermoplasmatota archaeon]
MVGTHNITYRIEDEEHTIIDHVQIEVIDVNDAPSIISADTLNSNTVYLAGENIALLASASDPDEQWGEKLRYEWTSSIVGPIGNGNELTVTLQEGIHIITLEVFDDRGAMNSTSFSIIVLAEEKEQGEVMRTSTLYLIAGGGAFVLGLIIALLLIVLSVMKRKKDRAAEKKEEEKEEEKEEVKKAPALTPDPKDQLKPGLKPGAPENRQLPPAVSQPENVVPRINGTRGQEPARAPVSQPVSPSPGPSGPSPESVKTEPGPTPSQMPQQSTPEQTIPETQPQTANLTQQVPPIQKQNLVPQPSNAPQGFTAQPKIEDPSSEGGK